MLLWKSYLVCILVVRAHITEDFLKIPVNLVAQLPGYQYEAFNSELSVNEGNQFIFHPQNVVKENSVGVDRGCLALA